MIDAAVSLALFACLVMFFLILVLAFISIADDKLDGLIKKKLKKRFGGDE